jgi:hypothetical protein
MAYTWSGIGVGYIRTGGNIPGVLSAYSAHLPKRVRTEIWAQARDSESLGGTTSLKRSLVTRSVMT